MNSFYWSDLIDTYLRFNKAGVKGYVLPSLSSNYETIFSYFDPLKVYSYVIGSGKIWLMYYNVITKKMNYIPLNGDPGNGIVISENTLNSVFFSPGILTVEQQQQQQNEETNSNPLDGLVTAIKGIGTVLLIGYVLNTFTKIKKITK